MKRIVRDYSKERESLLRSAQKRIAIEVRTPLDRQFEAGSVTRCPKRPGALTAGRLHRLCRIIVVGAGRNWRITGRCDRLAQWHQIKFVGALLNGVVCEARSSG